MKMKIWTVAADDDWGTRATVHTTIKEAYLQWLEWRFPGGSEAIDLQERNAAKAFIEQENYDGLWEWENDQCSREPFDTYGIEKHEIDMPQPRKKR